MPRNAIWAALPGMLSVLHTWNGQLGYHPHVHMLITGGGITADGEHWQPARGEFLVPVAVLSRKIAAKFRDALKKQKPELFATIPAASGSASGFRSASTYGHGNDAVLNYLSRYVFRMAISNARILAVDDTHVTFPLQGPPHRHLADHPTGGRRVPATISAARPAARFSQGPLLRTLASLEARLVKPGVAAADPPESDRRHSPDDDRGSDRSVGRNLPSLRATPSGRRGS